MVSFEKKEINFVVIICNYSVGKVKGNEPEMVHCLLCGMDYFNFCYSLLIFSFCRIIEPIRLKFK